MVGIYKGITISAIGFNIWAVAAGIKKYKSIIKEKENKGDKIVLLGKSILYNIEVLIFNALIHLNICHDGLVLINNMLKKYDKMKEKNKNWKI